MSIKKVVNDYKRYLDHVEEQSKHLDWFQKRQLETILSSQLTLLIALKRDTGLGIFYLERIERRFTPKS